MTKASRALQQEIEMITDRILLREIPHDHPLRTGNPMTTEEAVQHITDFIQHIKNNPELYA